jgi:hypothetical protein
MAKTLAGYATAAGLWCAHHFALQVPIYLPASLAGKATLHPFLAETINQRRKWQQPKDKKEPFTTPMFYALRRDVVILAREHPSRLLDRLPAIFDWAVLGVFTGSRLGEYGQSKPRRGELFAVVPTTRDAGEWAGTPLAFMRSDFSFFDAQRCLMSCSDTRQLLQSATEVHVRFRSDKSPNNFSIRKFRRSSGHFICAVKASISIIQRADLLQIPSQFPIGVYRCSAAGDYRFIRGADLSDIMRYACRAAYPDEQHYMRLHIDRMAHSNRVTACLALHQADIPVEVIAFCLRWTVPSVQYYIRESYSKIGEYTRKAVAGAALTT